MKNRLLFCLMLFSLKLLVNGESDETNTGYRKAALDLCLLQSEIGACTKKIKRYYYNTIFRRCIPFEYSGCEGNLNNFHTQKECDETCPGKIVRTSKPIYCFNEPELGNCNSNELRYYYDGKKDDCLRFTDGGCNEYNKNRFESIEQCFNECRIYEFSLQLRS